MPKEQHIDLAAAKRIKIVRDHLKINQTELAKICGISQAMISLIEKGEREISYPVLKFLLLKKNISPSFIISGILPIENKKENKKLITNISDLKADIEILKARIR